VRFSRIAPSILIPATLALAAPALALDAPALALAAPAPARHAIPQATMARSAPADGAVPVHIAGIHLVGPEQVMLLLADAGEEKALPISVGRDQGMAIYMGREKTATPRPMTHDLLVTLLRTLAAEVERVTVTALRKETYFAEIALRADGGRRHTIDARPSDAIALAVRMEAPIYSVPGLLRPIGDLGRRAPTTRSDNRIGVSVQPLDPDLAEVLGAAGVEGVLVASVLDGGPAARAGLRRGDIVRRVDGAVTATLEAWHAATATGPARQITVWREGRTLALDLPGADR
jgi:bifunctional DNase/RNase